MTISVIITLYKDLNSLNFVLEGLRRQTYKDFEVIIAEDDDDSSTKEFLKKFDDLQIVHLSHPDRGRNKVGIQNKAIAKASGEYLFFIDGDIVPFKHFIEYSLKIAKPGRVLSGRRVNLPENITKKIKKREIDITDIENHYLLFAWKYRKDKEIRVEQGIELNPDGLIYKIFLSKRKRNTEILGCNFSCFKKDIIAINGFDEGYGDSIIGQEDTDLTWRFRGLGYELFSSKNIACCFHLWHKVNSNRNEMQDRIDLQLMQEKKNKRLFVCREGVNKYLQ